ncbi:MAG TPA: GNAT family N-acetyltransferase [Paenibacillus sp.]|uniref:GNAT family N-acetyltransferase n=1 Tax=Paenibacillus TaxID=44249 RepID=UPI00211AAA75|nr:MULTISPECIES: GNAT family N-acetyltransferase [unclassified Paenibacillus]MDH6369549.1 N-acetylglutamate synthase-like GNAT family acetyltransferase [Paenibacillus sp. PastF-3]
MNSSTMAPVLEIRKCGLNDLERVTALLREFGYPTTLSVMKERLESMENNHLQCTLVAELNNEVVGMVGLRQVISYYKQTDCITEITALIVSEELRGNGLGKRLVAAAEEWAREQGCCQLFLRSGNRVERAPAHSFYRHLGFEKTAGYRFNKALL